MKAVVYDTYGSADVLRSIVEQGQIHPVVEKVLSMEEPAEVNQRMLQLQQQITRTYNKDLLFLLELKNPEERVRSND